MLINSKTITFGLYFFIFNPLRTSNSLPSTSILKKSISLIDNFDCLIILSNVSVFIFLTNLAPLPFVLFNVFFGVSSQWNQTLFVSFPSNEHHIFFEIEIRYFEFYQFTYTQTTSVKGFNDGSISMT